MGGLIMKSMKDNDWTRNDGMAWYEGHGWDRMGGICPNTGGFSSQSIKAIRQGKSNKRRRCRYGIESNSNGIATRQGFSFMA